MKILKYILIALIILDLPSAMLFLVGGVLGSFLSYSLYGLLIIYLLLNKYEKPNLWMLFIGLSYYTLSGLQFLYGGEEKFFYIAFVKFLIIILSGNVLVKKISDFDFFIFLLIGSLSIIIHGVFFPDNYGRYSGLYFNPNEAGFIAILGYSLTYGLKNKYLKTLAQIIFTIAGLVTFSRTFILIWLLLNLLSLRINIKNIRILALGLGLFIALLTFGELFNLSTVRLNRFTAVLNNEKGALVKANEGSRTETWSIYYDNILESPFIGNGYSSFTGNGIHPVGVHNSFLMILGESGIIPFILFSSLYFYIFFWGLKLFNISANILMISIAILFLLLTFHNFFTTNYLLIISLWVCHQINIKKQLL